MSLENQKTEIIKCRDGEMEKLITGLKRLKMEPVISRKNGKETYLISEKNYFFSYDTKRKEICFYHSLNKDFTEQLKGVMEI